MRKLMLQGCLLIALFFSHPLFASTEYAQKTPDELKQALPNSSGAERVLVLDFLTRHYSRARNVDEGLPLALEGLRLETEYPNPKARASLHITAAQLLTMNKAFEQAAEHFLNALAYYESTNNLTEQAAALSGLGSMYKIAEHFQLSLDYNERAKALYESLDDQNGIMAVTNNIAGTELLVIEKMLGERAYQTSKIALNDEEQEKLEQVLATYQKLVTITEGMEPHYYGVFGFNVGLVQNYLGNSVEAIKVLEKVVAIWQEFNSDEALIRSHTELAKAYFRNNQLDAALAQIEQAQARQTNSLQLQIIALKYALPILLALDRKEEALAAYRQYRYISEQYANESATLRAEASNKLAEIRQKDQLIETLNLQNSLKEVELEKIQLMSDKRLYGLMLLAILVVLLTFLWRTRVQAAKIAEQHNKELRQQALTDQLTSLYNRRAFEMYANHEDSMYQRSRKTYSLAILDIDLFKKINDTYGHNTGDTVLQAVAKCITSSSRDDDIVARWGGEEFVILFHATGKEVAMQILQRIAEHVAAINIDGLDNHPLSFSAGVVESVVDEKWNTRLAVADKLLYKAKEAGRNRILCEK